MGLKLCKICNTNFETNMSWSKYCSDKCKRQARNLENSRYTRVCPNCGKTFTSRYSDTPKSCSVACATQKYTYDKTEVIDMLEAGVAVGKIAASLVIPREVIYTIAKRNNLSPTSIRYKTSLTTTQRSIIRGGLLGDAHARQTPSGKYGLVFRHGPKQYKYLDWKYQQFKNITRTAPKIIQTPDAFGKEAKTFRTLTNATITEIASELYIGGVKTVNLSYLNKLDNLAIAVWLLDDGCLTTSPGLATHGFTIEESRLIAIWLSNKYNVREPRLCLDKRCQKYGIRFHVDLTQALIDDLIEIIINIPGMYYKIESAEKAEFLKYASAVASN